MALIQCDFTSLCLMRDVHFNIYLPGDRAPGGNAPKKPYKTLYLLHEYSRSSSDYLGDGSLGELSEKNGLAIVIPDGENHFYVDDSLRTEYYGKFIGQELVEFTRRTFPLSRRREDTFIGGFSMGGFGALHNGLRFHDTFGQIIGISPAIITEEIKTISEKSDSDKAFFRAVFGDFDTLEQRDIDLFALTKRLHCEGAEFPGIYFCCGKNDRLSFENKRLEKLFAELGIPHTYVEDPGTHDSEFFYPHLRDALSRLDLDRQPVLPNPFWID